MANKSTASMALFLALNLMLFNMALSSYAKTYPPPLESCPSDTLKLKICANVLGLVHLQIPGDQNSPCCSLISNLINLDAAACLCTAVHANILNLVYLNLNIDLTALVNYCGCHLPAGFQCLPRHA